MVTGNDEGERWGEGEGEEGKVRNRNVMLNQKGGGFT